MLISLPLNTSSGSKASIFTNHTHFFSGGKFDKSPTKNKALLNLYRGSFEQNSPFLEFEIMTLKTKYNNLETFVVLILDIDSWLCVLDRSHPRLWLWW